MTATTRPVCRHCCRKSVNRPKLLCFSCYYRPGVRDLYPSTSKFARRGAADFNGRARLPEPTGVVCGTPDKVRVLCERAERRQELFHPEDERRLPVTPEPEAPRKLPQAAGPRSNGHADAPLTGRQQQILDFITAFQASHGCPPTVREIADHCGIKSPNGVVCHLDSLEQKGYLTREGGKSRSIRLTRPAGETPAVESDPGSVRVQFGLFACVLTPDEADGFAGALTTAAAASRREG